MSVHVKSRVLEEPNRLVENQICARDARGRAETGRRSRVREIARLSSLGEMKR
jgi:hypothetical protein